MVTLGNDRIRAEVGGNGDKVRQIQEQHDQRRDDQRSGQVLFGIFDLVGNGGGNDPAIVGESHRRDAHDPQSGFMGLFREVAETADGVAPDEPAKSQHHKGNDFDHAGNILKDPAETRRDRIVEIAEGDEAETDETASGHGDLPAEKGGSVDPHDKGNDNGQRGIINKRMEPAEGGTVAHTDKFFGIGDDTAGFIGS